MKPISGTVPFSSRGGCRWMDVGISTYRGALARSRPRGCCGAPASGPRPGRPQTLAKLGLRRRRPVADAARRRSGSSGPTRTTARARALAPQDAWGHDHLWWLDRMVRTQAPLVERMTLVWHDWFATSQGRRAAEADAAPERAAAPARARQLRAARARHHARPGDAAVAQRHVQQPLGRRTRTTRASCRSCSASAPAAATRERDVRAAGPGADRLPQRLDATPARRASASTRSATTRARSASTASAARYGWQEGVRLVTRHRRHPEFMVTKLWGYFIPTKPSAATVKALVERCTWRTAARCARCSRRSSRTPTSTTPASGWSSRRSCRPRACCAPSAAGSTRPPGRGCARAPASTSSCRRTSPAGTTRAGWTPRRSARRWQMAQQICEPGPARPRDRSPTCPPTPPSWSAAPPRSGARRALSGAVRGGLERYAADTLATADEPWKQTSYPVLALNALRMLVATSPDYLTS